MGESVFMQLQLLWQIPGLMILTAGKTAQQAGNVTET